MILPELQYQEHALSPTPATIRLVAVAVSLNRHLISDLDVAAPDVSSKSSMQHNGVDREAFSIQDRIQAMNRFDDLEESKMPFSGSTNNRDSAVVGTDVFSPEEELEEKSYPKRSSVVDMWRKREASIKPLNRSASLGGSFKFEEKKEVQEDESERDSAPPEKRSTLHSDARTVTPERSESEFPFNNLGTPASTEEATNAGARRSGVRDSWKKRSPTVSRALPPSTPTKATTSSMTTQSQLTPSPRIPQSPSRTYERGDGGDGDLQAGQYKADADRASPQSVWRNKGSISPLPAASSSEAHSQNTKERIDWNAVRNGTSNHPSISVIERTNSHASNSSGTGENYSSNNSTSSNFDELRSKWAKFGVQQQQHSSTQNGSPKVPPSSPKASFPKPSISRTKAAYSPRVGMSSEEVTNQVLDSKPQLQQPGSSEHSASISRTKSAYSPRVGMSSQEVTNQVLDSKPQLQQPRSAEHSTAATDAKSLGPALPKRTPYSPNHETVDADESKPSIKRHFVKLGQLHASRPKVDSPTGQSPNAQLFGTMYGESSIRQQSPKLWSPNWPSVDTRRESADLSPDKSSESMESSSPMDRNTTQMPSPAASFDVPSNRTSFRRMNETKSLRAKHRLRAQDRSIERKNSGDIPIPSSSDMSATAKSSAMGPLAAQPEDTFIPTIADKSDGTVPLGSSDDYTTAGSYYSRKRSTQPTASKDFVPRDSDANGDSSTNRTWTGQKSDDMLRSSLPMQTLFGVASEENASGDEMSRSMLFLRPAHPEFSLSVSNSHSFGASESNKQEPENSTATVRGFDSWNGNPTFSKDAVASSQNSEANSSIATSLTSRASKRLRDKRHRPTGSQGDDLIQSRNEPDAYSPVAPPSTFLEPPSGTNRDTASHPSNSSEPAVPHGPSKARSSRPTSYKQPPSIAKNRLDPPDFPNAPPFAPNGSYASASIDESTAISQSHCSETTGTQSNSYMHSTFASGITSDAGTQRERPKKNAPRPSRPVVPLANEMVPDEFVSEKNASVESFKIAYERMSLEQIASDIRDEASSVLNIEFINKGMSAAGESINKIVAGEMFQKSSPKKIQRRAPSPVEEVAIEVEYIADSDDEPVR